MEISSLILSYLMENGSAPVQGFGTFYLEKVGASYSKKSHTLQPPATQVFFAPDFDLNDDILTTKPESHEEFTTQLTYWRNNFKDGEPFEIPGIGKFSHEQNGLRFHGEKIFTENPDFYGLEEIPIANLKSKKAKNRSFWPAAVSLIAITTIGTMSYLNPELLFGKKSFPEAGKNKIVQKKSGVAAANYSQRRDSISAKDSVTQTAPTHYKKTNFYRKKSWKAKRHWNH